MQPDNKMERRRNFLVNIAYWAVILALVFFIMKYFLNMVMPLFLAVIFASVSRPLSRFLSSDIRWKKGNDGEKIPVKRKMRLNPSLAGIVSVLLLFLVIGALLALILVRLGGLVTDIITAMPIFYSDTLLPWLVEVFAKVETFAARFDADILAMVQDTIPDIIAALGSAVANFSAKAVSWLSTLAGKLPSFLLSFIITLIATVFIAVDFDTIKGFIKRNLPARPLQVVTDVKNTFVDIIWQFLKSYFLIFVITATEITIGLLIIGKENPLLLGMLVAIFDAFPIVGSGMILLPWAVITLISGSLWQGIGLFILYLTVVIVRQVIEPKIVGKHVGLRPIVTLGCMFIGTRLFGGLGLLGLPIAAAILADLNDRGLIHLFKRAEPKSTK
ncbi:MAG: sporulation integral membrane protein YtvI [Oscillospiraceae bacterium]|nr:sporulation integral membrane protein YtvI [Oscillospiraceae bacterium]